MANKNINTIAIRFTDQIYQCGFFDNVSPKKDLIEPTPLYISFTQTNIEYDEKAFKSIHGFSMMKSREYIRNKLNSNQKEVTYQLPTEDELWCIFMKRIIDCCITKTKSFSYEVGGIVLSLPNHLEKSLREMIMNAVEFCERTLASEYKKQIRIITVSNALSSSVVYSQEINKNMSVTETTFHKPIISCLVEMEFEQTNWTIVYCEGQKSIILKTGYIERGMFYIFKELKRRLVNEMLYPNQNNRENLEYEEWDSRDKNKYEDWAKTMMNYYQVNKTAFKDENDDDNVIDKDDFAASVMNETKEIVEKLMNSIHEVNEWLMKHDSITINGMKIDLTKIPKNERRVTDYLYDTEWKNVFFSDYIQTHYGDEIRYRESNGTKDIVLSGAIYLSRMFSDRLIGEQHYQKPSTKIHQESIAIELIQPHRFTINEIQRNEFGKEIPMKLRTFPQHEINSNELISLGNLKGEKYKPIKYQLYDNQKEIIIGNVFVDKTGEYHFQCDNLFIHYVPGTQEIKKQRNYDCFEIGHINEFVNERDRIVQQKHIIQKNSFVESMINVHSIENTCDVIPIQHFSLIDHETILMKMKRMNEISLYNQQFLGIKSSMQKQGREVKSKIGAGQFNSVLKLIQIQAVQKISKMMDLFKRFIDEVNKDMLSAVN